MNYIYLDSKVSKRFKIVKKISALQKCSTKPRFLAYFEKVKNTLWRACNLTSFAPCLTVPVDYLLLPITRDPGSNPQGVLM
jgi:hypothetical protein